MTEILTEREQFIQGLRELADVYENSPELPVPSCSSTLYLFLRESDGDVKQLLGDYARMLKPVKKCTIGDSHFGIRRTFGKIDLDVLSDRALVCERRVISTEHIPEKVIPEHVIPARDAEIVEWVCPQLLVQEETAEVS